jgi:hypothetical protein
MIATVLLLCILAGVLVAAWAIGSMPVDRAPVAFTALIADQWRMQALQPSLNDEAREIMAEFRREWAQRVDPRDLARWADDGGPA